MTTTYMRWLESETVALIPGLLATEATISGGTVSGPKRKSWRLAISAARMVMAGPRGSV